MCEDSDLYIDANDIVVLLRLIMRRSENFRIGETVNLLDDFETSKGIVTRGSIATILERCYDKDDKLKIDVYGIRGPAVILYVLPESVQSNEE